MLQHNSILFFLILLKASKAGEDILSPNVSRQRQSRSEKKARKALSKMGKEKIYHYSLSFYSSRLKSFSQNYITAFYDESVQSHLQA